MLKICSKCKISKSIDNFYKQHTTKDGYQYQCCSCSSKRVKHKIDTYNLVITAQNELLTRTDRYNKQRIEQQKIKKVEYYKKTKETRATEIRNKLTTDPLFRLRHNLKNLIRNSIKNNGYKKTTKTARILGCSIIEFKEHIENQFFEGMSWNNYGEWEYDHIRPVSWAKSESEIIELNHYSNFQPLWKKDNRSKSNRFCG
jgi:hypothetical protein